MNAYGKIAIVVALALVVGAVLFAKQDRPEPASDTATGPGVTREAQDSEAAQTTPAEARSDESAASASTEAPTSARENRNLPRVVDLGASKCIPCKMMAPILEELRTEYEGRMEVVFIDVWENREAGEQYGIRTIPTQIFYDASGKERFRHEGFYSKEDILAKCEELGFDPEAK